MTTPLRFHFALAMLAMVGTLQAAPIPLDNFEFATDNTAAAAAVVVSGFPAATGTAVSGTAANANEGTFSIGLNGTLPGTAFEDLRFARTLPAPVSLGGSFSTTGGSGSNITDLAVTIDISGNTSYAGASGNATTGTNIWIFLREADGDVWRYINFLEPALGTAGYANDVRMTGLIDRDASSTGDGNLTQITAYDVLIQNPVAQAKSGVIYFDDLKIEAIDPNGGFTYTIPKITTLQAPNVTDTVFDAIYANSGSHAVIGGDQWKDWAQRISNPQAGISTNTTNTSAATGIFNTSKAYLISDGTDLFFGMIVYDSNTALMTADSGDDTVTKFNVEDIEVAFSSTSGTAGAADAVKFAQDAFGHIDDMMPDGTASINTTAKVNSNSYIINSTSWACEFRVGIDELITLSQSNLTTPLPSDGIWYGHVGYQSPGIRIPLYAAGNGNGFGNFTVAFDLSALNLTASAESWMNYQ